jgi:hypothetical protein
MKSFPLLLFLPLFIAAVTSLTVFLIQPWHHQTSATAADGCVTYRLSNRL